MFSNKYDVVIGIEVHAELKTKTKMFSDAPVTFGQEPNTQCNEIDLAYPGTMPTVNKAAVRLAILLGTALNMEISKTVSFDRKNYYYPDLPKGFQITQQYNPINKDGFLEIKLEDNSFKKIRIERAHLEEDTAKQIHGDDNISYLDFNRCGNPLIEIVSQPDLSSAREVVSYLKQLQNILLYANVSDVKMENGSMRCDANVSLKLKGALELGKKVEIKNMNSISNVEQAINNEIEIQIEKLDNGIEVEQVTKRFDDVKKANILMRLKGDDVDYRYIPESNILPILLDQNWVDDIQASLPKLPKFYDTFYRSINLENQLIEQLINNYDINSFFYECCLKSTNYKAISHWVITVLNSYLNKENLVLKATNLNSDNLVEMINIIENGIISSKQGELVFKEIITNETNPKEVIKKLNLSQISDENLLQEIVQKLIDENDKMVMQFGDRPERVIKFLVGQTMKQTKGKANPKVVINLIKNILS